MHFTSTLVLAALVVVPALARPVEVVMVEVDDCADTITVSGLVFSIEQRAPDAPKPILETLGSGSGKSARFEEFPVNRVATIPTEPGSKLVTNFQSGGQGQQGGQGVTFTGPRIGKT